MWQVRSCSSCGNEIFAKPDKVDAMCGKCEEIEELRNKVERMEMMYENTGSIMNRRHQINKIERYEKALKEVEEQKGLMEFLDENDWASTEDYFTHIARKALRG